MDKPEEKPIQVPIYEINIYLADPEIRMEQLEILQRNLPAGWALTHTPGNAVAILTENADVSREMLLQAPRVRMILRLDTGRARVARTHIPTVDLSSTALIGVAEHVVTLVLALSRRLLWVARQSAAAAWAPGKDQPVLTDQKNYTYNWIGLENSGAIYNKKVGIVGLGHIGRAVALRLRPFGVRLLYTDLQRFPPAVEKSLGVQWRQMDDLLKESDFVTLHLRFIEGPQGNEKMFGEREFNLMKPGAFFINTSRGRLVDEDALVEALRAQKIGGAGLDVFRYEPLPKDHPLLSLAGDRVILTSHTAGSYNPEAWQTTAEEIIERVQEVVS
jgi:phosphoglycerate dehydrogenase-like enzyme